MHEEQQNLALSKVKIKDPIPIRRNKPTTVLIDLLDRLDSTLKEATFLLGLQEATVSLSQYILLHALRTFKTLQQPDPGE
jgi:hypothetical protein